MEAAMVPGARFMFEDLLNFTLDAGEKDYCYDENTLKAPSSSSTHSNSQDTDDVKTLSNPDHAEEELEWLLDKDAFPSVETCLDILSPNSSIALYQHSPVSVLDPTGTTTTKTTTTTSCCGGGNSILAPVHYPVKPRSKRLRLRRLGASSDVPGEQYWCWSQVNIKNSKEEVPVVLVPPKAATIGRRCQHCRAEKTPQWRAGPMGPKTLCNACGVRYKSGRLVAEYRPASSPTFSSLLHSNSHRKVMEMRKQKQMGEMVMK